jgi:hypothetical protein
MDISVHIKDAEANLIASSSCGDVLEVLRKLLDLRAALGNEGQPFVFPPDLHASILREDDVKMPYDSACPACVFQRVHTGKEWEEFHPDAGTGFKRGDGPSPPPSSSDSPAPA